MYEGNFLDKLLKYHESYLSNPTYSDNIRLISSKNHDNLALAHCLMPFAKPLFLFLLGFRGQAKQVQLLYQATYILCALKVRQEGEGCVDFHTLTRFNAYVYFRKRTSRKNGGNAAFTNALDDLM